MKAMYVFKRNFREQIFMLMFGRELYGRIRVLPCLDFYYLPIEEVRQDPATDSVSLRFEKIGFYLTFSLMWFRLFTSIQLRFYFSKEGGNK